MNAPGPFFLLPPALFLALFVAVLLPPQVASASTPNEIRALWIQAWVADLHTPEGIDQVIAHAKAANMNTLVPQVRRRGDTLYFSEIEPRIAQLANSDFDALQYMIDQAHAQNPPIEVHAWIVVYPISTSSNPDHISNKHPEWLMHNADGGINDQHDPGHPGVHQHLLDVSMELVQNYSIDGLHFDYVRYPEHAGSWGYNPVSVARFQQLYNRNDTPSNSDSEWQQFRRDQITQTVRRIYLYAMEARPDVKISAATITWGHVGVSTIEEWPSSAAYGAVFQDWRGWMEEGILDLNIPMNYYRHHNNTNPDHAQAYYNWSGFAKDHKYNRHLAIGPALYLNTISNSLRQIRHTREATSSGNTAEGSCGYTYHATDLTWNTANPIGKEVFYHSLANPSAYDPITPPVFAEPAGIPEMPWKTNPTTGHLKGYVRMTETGDPIDGAMVHLSGTVERSIQTDPTGFYGFVDLPPGDYAVSAIWKGNQTTTEEISVLVGSVSHQDLGYIPPPPTTGQLEGFVRNATTNQSVSGAIVQLSGAAEGNIQTNAQGFYRFQDLPPGHYTVGASWDESVEEAPATMVSVSVGLTTHQNLHFAVAGEGGVPGTEIILDNRDGDVSFIGVDWRVGTGTGGYGADYHWTHNPSHANHAGYHSATFSPKLATAGLYRIETWYLQGSNRTPDAPYIISDGQSETVVAVNQTTNGSQWFTVVDAIFLDPKKSSFVKIENQGSNSVTMADAIRWTLLEPIDPEFSITTLIEGAGRIEGIPPTAPHNASLDLEAIGESGFIFSHWNGKNAWGSANPLSIKVGADLEIGAVFIPAWEAWIAQNFSETEREDPAFIARGADPFGHGLSNLLKFAFGLALRQPDRTLLPAVSADESGVVLTFRRLQGDMALEYIIEFSDDLIDWASDLERIDEIATEPGDDATEIVTVRVSAADGTRLFVRLRVEQN